MARQIKEEIEFGGVAIATIGLPMVAIFAGCEKRSLRSMVEVTSRAVKTDGGAGLSLHEIFELATGAASPDERAQA